MYLMYVTTRCYPITKALLFTFGQPFKANGRWCYNEHNQIDMGNQRFSPAHTRAGQHPIVVTERLLDQ